MSSNYPGALDAYPTDVDGITSAVSADQNNRAAALVALQKYGYPVYNVRTYGGATGNGTTDDTAAIQATLNACRTAGGGVVYFPPGTYALSMAVRTGGFSGEACALMYPGNCVILGAGRDATTLRLLNSQNGNTGLSTTTASIWFPWNVSQEQVTFADLTLDGNAGNQTDTMSGFYIWRQRGVKFHRVRVKDCRGTANAGGAAETFCWYVSGSTDVSHVDCEAIQTSGTVSNGFVANGSTNVHYLGCRAIGIGTPTTLGFGFNVGTGGPAGSRQVLYVACASYLCGNQGYHIDASNVQGVTYQGCVAGGIASDLATGQQYPFTASQSLGNNIGFECTVAAQDVSYIGCLALNNTAHGFEVRAGTGFQYIGCVSRANGGSGLAINTGTPDVAIVGGDFSGNTQVGINIGSTTVAAGVRVKGSPTLSGNTTAAISVGGTNYSAPPANVAAPGVPGTTTALTNPFGFDASVCVTPGASTCAVALDGTATGVTLASSGVGQMFRVPAKGTITLTYTSAPTWTWFLE